MEVPEIFGRPSGSYHGEETPLDPITKLVTETLTMAQKLEETQSDQEKVRLLNSIKGNVLILKRGDRAHETLDPLHQTVSQLITTRFSRDEHPETIEALFQLHTELDPHESPKSLQKLISFYLEKDLVDKAFNIALSLYPILPQALRQRILDIHEGRVGIIGDYERDVCEEILLLTNLLPLNLRHIRALTTLDQMLSSDPSTLTITSEQATDLVDLFVYAYGNRLLNERISALSCPSPAENVLLSFSFRTLHVDEVDRVLQRLSYFFKEGSIVSSAVEYLAAIKNALTKIASLKEGLSQAHFAAPFSEHMSKLIVALETLPKDRVSYSYLQNECEEAIEKARTSLKEALRTLIASKVPQKRSHAVKMVVAELNQLLLSIEENILSLPEKDALVVVDSPDAPSVTQNEVISFVRMHRLDDDVASLLSNETVASAWQSCNRLRELTLRSHACVLNMEKLEALFQAFPELQPGDLLFLMEDLHIRSDEPQFAKIRQQPVSATTVQHLVSTVQSKGIYAIQSFFTGGALHASLVYGKEQSTSVVAPGYADEIHFSDFISYITIRPNFLKLTTAEGVQLLMQSTGKSCQEIAELLQEQFATELNNHILEAAKEHFFLDQSLAIRAAMIETEKTIWQHPLGYILGPLAIGARKVLEIARRAYLGPAAKKEATLCSILVVTIFEAVLKKMEQNLHSAYSIPENISILTPLLPSTIDRTAVHPSTLLHHLQHQEIGLSPARPLALQVLMGS